MNVLRTAIAEESYEGVTATPATVPVTPAVPADSLSGLRLVEDGGMLPPNTAAEAAREFFARDNRALLVVADPEGGPLGVIERGRFMGQLASRYGFSLFAGRSLAQIMETEFLTLDARMNLATTFLLASQRPVERRLDPVVVIEDGKFIGTAGLPSLLFAYTRQQQLALVELERLRAAEAEATACETARRQELEHGIGVLLGNVSRHAAGDLSPRPHEAGVGPLAAVDRGIDGMRAKLSDLISGIQIAAHETRGGLSYLHQLAGKFSEGGARQLQGVQDLMQSHEFLRQQFRTGAERARQAAAASRQGLVMVEAGAGRLEAALGHGQRLDAVIRRSGETLTETGVMLETAGSRLLAVEQLAAGLCALTAPGAEPPVLAEVEGLAQAVLSRTPEHRAQLRGAVALVSGLANELGQMQLLSAQGGRDGGAARAGLSDILEALRGMVDDLAEIASRLENQNSLLTTSEGAVAQVLQDAEENLLYAKSLDETAGRLAGDGRALHDAAARFTVGAER